MRLAFEVFNRSIFDSYKHLGTLIWASILWTAFSLPVFTVGPATAALFKITEVKQEGLTPAPMDFWRYFLLYFKRGIQLKALYLMIVIPGFLSLFFVFQTSSFIWFFIGVIFIYLLVLWHIVILLAFPLLVKQSEARVSIVIIRSLRLVSENFWFSINITLYAVLLLMLSTIFTIALLIAAGTLSVFLFNALLMLMQKYDPESTTFDSGVSWKGALRPWKA